MTTAEAESVFLLDVNVLVALTNPSHVHHTASHRWLATVASWATTPTTESALVRLLLNPAVTGQDVSRSEAIGIVRALRAHPQARFLPDTSTFAEPLVDLSGLVSMKQVTDFHLVNLAAAAGAVLATFDSRLTSYLDAGDRQHVLVLS